MNRRTRGILTLAVSMTLALLVTACSTTQSASTQVDDTSIHAAVKAKLTVDRFSNIVNIDINVTNGVVTLAGEVPERQGLGRGAGRGPHGLRRRQGHQQSPGQVAPHGLIRPCFASAGRAVMRLGFFLSVVRGGLMRTPARPIRAELFSAELLEQFAGELAAEQRVRLPARRGRRLLARLARECAGPHVVAPGDRGGQPADPRGLSRGRLAAEQLSHRRGTGSRDPGGSPPGVLPGAAQARRRGARGLSPGVRAGLVVRRAHRQPDRARDASPVRPAPTSASSRCRSASCGRWRSRCESCSSRISGAWPSAWPRGESRADRADAIADALLGVGGVPKPEPAAVLEMLEQAPFSRAFAVALVQRLREQDPVVTPALEWLDRRLARDGTTAEEIVRLEHQEQIANHATVRNVITSMRLLSSADWADFFESVSLVHEALCDGTRVAEMDFATRDRYRHAVEELSRGSGARRARGGAARGGHGRGGRGAGGRPAEAADARLGDPGYYLIAKGRSRLERELAYRVPGRQWLRRAWVRAATPFYLASIGLSTLAILAVPLALTANARRSHVVGPSGRPPGACTRLRPRGRSRPSLRHAALGPRASPKLELSGGVPAELRTLVVIPMLLTDESEIEEVVERLEVHYLANADPELRFALLSDWPDAAAESIPEDAASVELARASIRQLNARHGPAAGGGDRFWLLHRRRLWNEREGDLDGLGAKARQAARAQSPPARRDGHDLPPARTGRAAGARGDPLRDHSRRRLAAAAGGGAPAGRNDRPPAQPFRASTPAAPGSWRDTASSSPA